MNLSSPTPDRLDTLSELFAVTFSEYWSRLHYVHDGYIRESNYDWQSSRIGTIDDTVVTHFGVWDFQMRIGSASCRTAGIGAVETHERYRKRGLMAQTASACVGNLREAGYELSLLFGIPGFYHKFGYVRSFSEGSFYLATRDITDPAATPEYERFEGDPTTLAKLYNAENAGVTGTYVRPTYRLNRMPKKFGIYTFDGGYVIAGRQGDALQMSDCAGDPATVIGVLRDLATKELCPEIALMFLPRRSRLGEYVQSVSHRFTSERNGNGGPMFRLLNLLSLSRKLTPVFDERLRGGGLGGYSGTLVLHGHEESVRLTISSGSVSGVDAAVADATGDGTVRAGAALVRFFVGDDHPRRICLQTGASLEGAAAWLAPVLFPDQEPSTILWDRF